MNKLTNDAGDSFKKKAAMKLNTLYGGGPN